MQNVVSSDKLAKREDRGFLLKIRNGKFEFDDLMKMVEEKMEQIKIGYSKSNLPDKPDNNQTEEL